MANNVTVADLSVNEKNAEEGIQRVRRAVQLLKTDVGQAKTQLSNLFVDDKGRPSSRSQFGILEQLKIDMEEAKALSLAASSPEEIKTHLDNLKQMEAQYDSLTGTVKKHSSATLGFRREQHLQNFIMREGTQALTSIAFAFHFLSGSQDGTNSTTKKLTESLLIGVAAANAVQFSLFSIGQAGEKTDGKLGKMMRGIGQWAGPIGIAVGAGAALITFLDELVQKADKVSELDLANFTARVGRLTKEELDKERNRVLSEIGALEKETPAGGVLGALGKGIREMVSSGSVAAGQAAAVDAAANVQTLTDLKARLLLIDNQIKKVNDETYSTIDDMNREIRELVAKRDQGYLTEQRAHEINEQILEIEIKKGRLLKSNTDIRREELNHLQEMLQLAASAERNQFDRRDLEIELEYQIKLAAIIEKLKKGELSSKQAEAQAEAAIEKKKKELSDNALAAMNEQAELQIANIRDEEERIRAKYAYEKQLIEDSADHEDTKKLKLAALEKQLADDLRDLNQRYLGDLAQSFSLLSSGLDAIGIKADSTFQRLLRSIQAAIRLAELLQRINAGEIGATAGGLGIIGSALGILGTLFGFQKGGYTGHGSPGEVAGVVHRREIVFEQPIVDRHREELLAMRAQLRAGGGMRTGGMGPSEVGVLVREIHSLRQQIAEMPPPVVVIEGTLEGQTFLRKEMPDFRKHESLKNID